MRPGGITMARSKKPLTIEIEKPSKGKLEKDGIEDWPIWEKEISTFDWHYDENETCYILEGKATVAKKTGRSVTFAKGDLVIFPKGLSCVWKVHERIKKHYKFG